MTTLNFEKLNADSKAQLACTLAAMILSDSKKEISSAELKKILTTAKIETAPHWPILFGSTLSGKNVTEVLSGSGSQTAQAQAPAGVQAQEQPKKEAKVEKQKEEEPEVDMDMGDMFG